MRTNAFILLCAALTAASPIAEPHQPPPPPPGCYIPDPPTLPINGGPSELPAPPRGLTLKHIALGFGIQNYTCSSPSSLPTSTGALATLYDITPLFPYQGPDSLSPTAFEALTALAVSTSAHAIPVNIRPLANDRYAASPTNPFPAPAPITIPSLEKPLQPLGHHFFDSQGNPVFELDYGATHLVAAKEAAVDAPASANKGPEGTGAVAWLALGAKPGANSWGASFVYRVVTAGGNSHGCSGLTGQDSTPYAAQYWFYG